MKNIYSSLFAGAITLTTPNVQAVALQNAPLQASTQPKWPNYQEMCEEQALIITRELLPQIRLRAERIVAHGLDSLEVKFRPDPSWPARYIQSQVAYFLNGVVDDTEVGKFSLDFPNPFDDFSLRYWVDGKYRLSANCKYPEKK